MRPKHLFTAALLLTVPALAGCAQPSTDADTLDGMDSTDFALADQACSAGQVVTGIDDEGEVECAADAMGGGSGSYALADQACAVGQVVTGVAADGTLTCAASGGGGGGGDADTLDGLDSTDFARSDATCPVGQVMRGSNAAGQPLCVTDDVDGGDADSLEGAGLAEISSIGFRLNEAMDTVTHEYNHINGASASLSAASAGKVDVHFSGVTGMTDKMATCTVDSNFVVARDSFCMVYMLSDGVRVRVYDVGSGALEDHAVHVVVFG